MKLPMLRPLNLLVCLSLTILLQTTAGQNELCSHENQLETLECIAPISIGVLQWDGSDFNCPSDQHFDNNTILITTNDSCPQSGSGVCGPYSANLECIDESTNLISTLVFTTRNSMNGMNVYCKHRGQVQVNTTLRISVDPPPPSPPSLSQVNGMAYVYQWDPPEEEVIGDIRGYHLTFRGNCGNCSNVMVNQSARSVACSATDTTSENSGEVCVFKIRTVTDDCGFLSEPRSRSDVLFSTVPTSIMVTVLCTEGEPHGVDVEWNYAPPPGMESSTALGFELEFTDSSINSFTPTICLNASSGSRSCQFPLMLLEESGLLDEDLSVFIIVTVLTTDGNFSSNYTDVSEKLPRDMMQCSTGCTLQYQMQCVNGMFDSAEIGTCDCRLYALMSVPAVLIIVLSMSIVTIVVLFFKCEQTRVQNLGNYDPCKYYETEESGSHTMNLQTVQHDLGRMPVTNYKYTGLRTV